MDRKGFYDAYVYTDGFSFFRDCIRDFKNRHNDGRHRVLADICKQWAAYGYIMSGVTDVVPYDCQKRGISYKKLKAVAVTK